MGQERNHYIVAEIWKKKVDIGFFLFFKYIFGALHLYVKDSWGLEKIRCVYECEKFGTGPLQNLDVTDLNVVLWGVGVTVL